MNLQMDAQGRAPEQVTVIGAGVVGVSTALFLRLAGVAVTLIDRDEPGSGCSSGNAGMLGVDSCVPVALPGVLTKIPSMLRSPEAPIGLDIAHASCVLPWLARFAWAARPRRVNEIARALHSLQVHLLDAYDVLLGAANARELVRSNGKLHVCETEAAFAETSYAREIQRRNGVQFEILDGAEVRRRAPALTQAVSRGIFYPNAAHSVNPQRMIGRFAQHFVALGGIIRRGEVHAIEMDADNRLRLIGADFAGPVECLVIAAGIWSRKFAKHLGSRIPLLAHRGYNAMLPALADMLPLPVKSEDRKILLTPMEHGLRVTGIAELAPPDHPPTAARTEAIISAARKMLPGFDAVPESTWLGSRPCTPDSLPVIGRAPRASNVVFAFGHGHLGLGLGAITGRVVCELLTTGRSSVDLAPFRPDRF